MIESRCGIRCTECGYKEKDQCKGCLIIDRPFWGECCSVKNCCEGRELEHCGKCDEFPCQLLVKFAYDDHEGDNGKRIEQCKKWAEE